MKYLVIVESPAKITKIQNYLNTIKNHSFIVDASYGHLFQFKNGLKSIDINNNFNPQYDIIKTKLKIAKRLKESAKNVDEVIIATDQDREGEAIGYHLIKLLNLKVNSTKRICFNEISKQAIVNAFNNPQKIDLNLYYAQQARSILDILIGYSISPLLWKSIKPKISAGRCQSPALKLVSTREDEIKNFEAIPTYEIKGQFYLKTKEKSSKIMCNFYKDIDKKQDVLLKIQQLVKDDYTLNKQEIKISNASPPPPYTTSSIQQDASNYFGSSPSNTMNHLQKLYESGKITYMRTDSIAISKDFKNLCRKYINDKYPDEFMERNYKNKTVNAQEAHECIRPVFIEVNTNQITDNFQKKLYDLIWKRTISCFMNQFKEEIHEYRFINNNDEYFKFTYKKIKQLGYKKILNKDIEDDSQLINSINLDTQLYHTKYIEATQKFSQPKPRYTEASLVKELENLGIGRPSTFSSIVNTLLKREYVIKEMNSKRNYIDLDKISISNNTISNNTFKSNLPSQKGKLTITDLGILVNQYMDDNFYKINSYQFTSDINDKLDSISNGDTIWFELVKEVYNTFSNKIGQLKNTCSNLKTDDTLLMQVDEIQYLYYRDKYGLCVIKKWENDEKKIRIKSLDSLTINREYLEKLFKYPKLLGYYQEKEIYLKNGKYGLYTEVNGEKISVEDDNITIDEILKNIEKKKNNVIKEWKSIKILNGPYGPYIRKGKNTISVPDNIDLKTISLKDCELLFHKLKEKKYKK